MAGAMTLPLVAGVELGGTKCIALLARGTDVLARTTVATASPAETLAALKSWLEEQRRGGHEPQALGIASFGPLGLHPDRTDFGFITTTPKPGWADVDVRGAFAAQFDRPVGFDTDVNAAALAEYRWGAAQGSSVAVYLTIGTGIGGGIVVGGRPVHGRVHPELGHLRVRRRASDPFPGICPRHGDCLEGLASGPAIAARTQMPPEQLADDHPVWADVAAELGEMVAALILMVSPDRVLIGGGVGTGKPHLLKRMRTQVEAVLGGYLPAYHRDALDEVILPPALGADAGALGAVAVGTAAFGV